MKTIKIKIASANTHFWEVIILLPETSHEISKCWMKTTCQGEKSIEEHVGEYKPWKFQMNSYFISLIKFTFLFIYESIYFIYFIYL